MSRFWGRLLLCLAALFWVVGVIVLYYAGHKPFSSQFALNICKAVGQFIASLMIVAVGGGIGLRLVPNARLRPLASVVLQASLGLGLLSLVVLVVGSMVGINPIIGWIGLVVIGILFRRHVLAWLGKLRSVQDLWNEAGTLGKVVIGGAFLIILAMLLVSISPPLKFDSLVYHLSMPKNYLDQGKIVYIPQFMYWGMPQTGEMLFTWAMSLAGTESATVLCWMMGLLALLGITSYASERLGKQAGAVSLAALLTVFTLTSLLPTGYIDWLVVLFGFSFMVMMDEWWYTGNRKFLVLAGIFAGFALASKYTAGILLIPGLVIIFLYKLKKVNKNSYLIGDMAYFALPVLLITLPWWIRNTLATGNPFYPFFFPAGGMDQIRLSFYKMPAWGNWSEIVLLPFRATIFGFEGTPGYSATIGPLLLVLCPFAFLGWKERSDGSRITLLIASIIGLSGLILWGIVSRLDGYLIQSRLYFAIFPAFAIMAGVGFDGLSGLKLPGIRIGRVVGVLVLLIFGFTVFQTLSEVIEKGSIQLFLGISSPDTYLDNNLGWLYPASQAMSELPSNARVLMLWEPRSFYCQPKCTADEVLDRWKHDLQVWHGPDAILTSWRKAGYTHLLYYKTGAQFLRESDNRYNPSDWTTLDKLLSSLKQPVDFGGAYLLYSLQ